MEHGLVKMISYFANALIGLGVICMFVFLSRDGIQSVSTITYNEMDNTTISVSDDIEYTGYTQSGTEYFDGEYTGAEVLENIMNTDVAAQIYVDSWNISSMTYAGMDFLTYCREVSKSPIDSMIAGTSTYLKKYTFDTDGNITSVRYVKR